MHTLTVVTKTEVPVKYLRARCGVRYWEDGTINDVEDKDGSLIPLRRGTAADNDDTGGGDWCPTIDLDTGIIKDWPAGVVANLHYKVCDDGDYELLDADFGLVKKIDGYVPMMMCPLDDGDGDYVIMQIDGTGQIANWSVDLSNFETDDEG